MPTGHIVPHKSRKSSLNVDWVMFMPESDPVYDSVLGSDPSTVQYLAEFTGPNTGTFGDEQTIGPTGSGATYEGYTTTGILRVEDSGAGWSSNITNNEFNAVVQQNTGGNVQLVGASALTIPAYGMRLGWRYKTTDVDGGDTMAIHTNPEGWFADFSNSLRMNIAIGGSLLTTMNGSGATEFTGGYTTATSTVDNVFYDYAVVLGGWTTDVYSDPSQTGSYGAIMFQNDGGGWKMTSLLHRTSLHLFSPEYITLTNGTGAWLSRTTTVDRFYMGDSSSTGEAVFEPNGKVFVDNVLLGDAIDHGSRNGKLFVKLQGLPSPGETIDVVFRSSWAIIIDNVGTVTVVEDYFQTSFGTPPVRMTCPVAATSSSIISILFEEESMNITIDDRNDSSAAYNTPATVLEGTEAYVFEG